MAETDPEKYRQIKEIFNDALAVDANSRSAFVESKCGDDAELIAEVASLLSSRDEAGEFMQDISAAGVVHDSFAKLDVFDGKVIGNYKIVREVGRGGMGLVFLAERQDFHQQAALKLIKRGMDSDAILDRFRREREILASLNHPNIARLYDGGTTDDGVPYFVMEYVDGVNIDEYFRQTNVSVKEKLTLFLKVCDAIAFAHRKLVVHRDLKPSNVLVTAEGEPKLLDFGIAKLLNSTEANETKTSQRALTPAYASPEQICGEPIGTTSDVFSLGKVLSELIDPAKADEDLKNVIAVAVRDEPERRYASVEKFADDIRRYLDGRPVSALPDTFGYRFKRFIGRNRFAAAAGIAILVVLIGGVAATLWQARKAQFQQARAEKRFDDVRALVNSYLTDLNDQMVKVSGNTKAREMLVRKTLEYLDKASSETGGDASLERELATAYHKIGDIQGNSYFSNLGNTTGALESYQKAIEIQERLAKNDPDNPDINRELAETYEAKGDVIFDLGDVQGRFDGYDQARAIMEKITARDPSNISNQLYLAQLYSSLSEVRYNLGFASMRDLSGALEVQNKALAIREPLAAANPDDKKINVFLNQSFSRMIQLNRVMGNFEIEFNYLARSQVVVEKFLALDPQNPNRKRDAAICYTRYATAYADTGDLNKAKEYSLKSVALREEIYHGDKTDVRAKRDVAYGYGSNADIFDLSGDRRGAIEFYQKQLTLLDALAKIDDTNADRKRDLVDVLINIGNEHRFDNDSATALTYLERAWMLNQTLKADDPENRDSRARIEHGKAEVLISQGKASEAIEMLADAEKIRESEVTQDSGNTLAKSDLATLYLTEGKAFAAIHDKGGSDYIQKSLAIWNELRSNKTFRGRDNQSYFETVKRTGGA